MLDGVAVIVEDERETKTSPFISAKGDFLMRWIGDSMQASDGPSITDGMIIHVHITNKAINGKPAFVRMIDGQIICRKYQEGPAGRFLEIPNPTYPNRIMPFPDDATVCGVIRGAWIDFGE